MATEAVLAGKILLSKRNTHRQKLKEIAGYSTFATVPSGSPTPGRHIGTGVALLGNLGDGRLGIQVTVGGEMDLEVEALADAGGVTD
jgi:hypothetical protein